jgi:hypothetical protein
MEWNLAVKNQKHQKTSIFFIPEILRNWKAFYLAIYQSMGNSIYILTATFLSLRHLKKKLFFCLL